MNEKKIILITKALFLTIETETSGNKLHWVTARLYAIRRLVVNQTYCHA
jgi:hypothetical protein